MELLRINGPGQTPGLLPRLAWARLPDGSDAIIGPRQAGDSINLFRISLNGELVPLTAGGGLEHWPVVSPSGELVFARTEVTPSVWSVPLAPSRESPRREAAPARMFGTSRDGSKLVFGRMLGADRGELVLHDRAKGQDILLASHDDVWNGGGGSFFAQVSPDGTQVAYRLNTPKSFDTYVVSTEGGATKRLKISETFSLASDWSIDGRLLIGECRPTSRGICAADPRHERCSCVTERSARWRASVPELLLGRPWITFMLRRKGATLIAVTPVQPDGSLAGEDHWIHISPPDANAGRSRFSPDGSALYYLLERASVLTLVRHAMDPITKRPVSAPVVLSTVSTDRTSLLPGPIVNLVSVTRDRVFFNLTEAHGNIWLTRLE